METTAVQRTIFTTSEFCPPTTISTLPHIGASLPRISSRETGPSPSKSLTRSVNLLTHDLRPLSSWPLAPTLLAPLNQPSCSCTHGHGSFTGPFSCTSATHKAALFFWRLSSLQHTSTPSRPHAHGSCATSLPPPSSHVKHLPCRPLHPPQSPPVSATPSARWSKSSKQRSINTRIPSRLS